MANTTDRGIGLFICIIVFTVVCSIFLLLRLWAARLIRRSFYLDDAMVIFAFVSFLFPVPHQVYNNEILVGCTFRILIHSPPQGPPQV